MISAARPLRRPAPLVVAAIAAAWILAIAAQLDGRARLLHHDALIEGGLPLWAAFGLLVVTWQAHIAATMLPGSLPLMRLFARAAAAQPRPRLVQVAFLAGYSAAWTGFGMLAFAGDFGIHALVHRWSWLAGHPFVIGAGALVLAGLYQFSGLKDRCLEECRHPAAFMVRYYRRGAGAAFRIGCRHGAFCLGCCWALMLVMFAAGVGNLLWMAPLALVMVVERTSRAGKRVVAPVGLGLIALAATILAHPVLGPAFFGP